MGIKNKDCFTIVDNHIQLNKDYILKNAWKFKKITGSKLSAVLGKNSFQSPFKIWLVITNLWEEKMDPLYQAGNVIEPKIRDYVATTFGYNFIVHNPINVKWNVFSKDSTVFGGIPDGELCDQNQQRIIGDDGLILEIKTASRNSFQWKQTETGLAVVRDENGLPVTKEENGGLRKWGGPNNWKIPIDYRLQLALYLYLRKQSHGMFAFTFLENDDYIHPEKFVATKDNIHIVKFNIDVDKLGPVFSQAEAWYNKYVKTGISPQITAEDYRWFMNEYKKP